MGFIYNVLLVVHFLGLASLVGGCLVQMSDRGERLVLPAMLHGAYTQVVTGILLVGLAEMADSLGKDVDHVKILFKLVIAVIIVVLCHVNRRRSVIPDGLYFFIGGLSVANIILAVFWS